MNDATDPWSGLVLPSETVALSARRTSAVSARDLFWALDSEDRCLLLLRHQRSAGPCPRLPRLRGLVVETLPEPGTDRQFLVLRLIESSSRELFHRLCLDIVDATAEAATEREAIECFLARTWRWHRLLSGGADGRLSEEEQKGLIGELDLLHRQLLPLLGGLGAGEAWTGPFGTPKDFEVGRICVEVKARRGAAAPQVLISSEHQLDTSGIDGLFLQVTEVTPANAAGADGRSLPEVIAEVREAITASAPSALLPLEERLAAVGFDASTDYSDRRWIIGARQLYRIVDGFPRITPAMHPPGLGEVRYAVSLPACQLWLVDPAALDDALRESFCHVGH
jgi:hypothetical protein